MKLLASLGSFGLAMWMFVASAVGAVPPAEKLLPPDTLFLLTVPDWDGATAAAKDFPLVQMWNDPAMKPFTYKFETKLREMVGEQDPNFKKDWPEFKALFGGQVTLALLRGEWPTEPGATPQLVFLMDVKDKAKALRDFIERWEKRDADAGKTIERETLRGVKFSRTRSNNGDGGANKSEPFAGQSGSLLLASESTMALVALMRPRSAKSTMPRDTPGFNA